MKKVFIVGDWGMLASVARMFIDNKWQIAKNIEEADLVQFTGGEDINPALYGEVPHPQCFFNNKRDTFEILVYKAAKELKKPMAGICRGGQFLNVMCGGSLWQHVNNHIGANFIHKVHNLFDNYEYEVSSCHHQMMIPAVDAWVIDVAHESTFKERMSDEGKVKRKLMLQGIVEDDPETVFYWDNNCLCIQGHPEYKTSELYIKKYFGYIEELSMSAKV